MSSNDKQLISQPVTNRNLQGFMPQNTNEMFSVYSKDMFDGVFEMTKEDIQSNGRQNQVDNSNFI